MPCVMVNRANDVYTGSPVTEGCNLVCYITGTNCYTEEGGRERGRKGGMKRGREGGREGWWVVWRH